MKRLSTIATTTIAAIPLVAALLAGLAGCAQPATAPQAPAQSGDPAQAQTAARPGTPPAASAPTAPTAPTSAGPDVDPQVIAALDAMARYLRGLDRFELRLYSLTDEWMSPDQTAQLGRFATLRVRRPNGLQMDLSDDRGHRHRLYYDGRTATVYSPGSGYYAQVAAAPTLREMLERLDERYGIELPAADLFYWDSQRADPSTFQVAQYLGVAWVDGEQTDQYVFRQSGVDWQLWVQRGERPLPRKLSIVTTAYSARPTHTLWMRWNLGPRWGAEAFAFKPPAGARRVPIRATDGSLEDGRPASSGAGGH